MSGFDLGKFTALFDSRNEQRKDIVSMARTAEAAERYDDMCKFMSKLVKWCESNSEPLTVEERNLLSVAYKNVIGARRASWRTLSAEEHEHPQLIQLYKKQVEKELAATCNDVLSLLETLSGNTSEDLASGEPLVFYLKMKGDYYRYLAESVTDEDNEKKAAENYKQAYELAQEKLKPTHPIRLGLALNYSVCFYEILKDKQAACELAKKAFDEAISKLDKLEEADYKDSTLIMQLLRDNLTLWTSSDGDDQGDQVQVEDLSDEEN